MPAYRSVTCHSVDSMGHSAPSQDRRRCGGKRGGMALSLRMTLGAGARVRSCRWNDIRRGSLALVLERRLVRSGNVSSCIL